MALRRRELLGYAVAGTTGMGITTAARALGGGSNAQQTGEGQYWRLGGVHARPAEIEDTAVTFRGSAGSSYETDYEVEVRLYYRPERDDGAEQADDSWREIAEGTALLSEGVYLETTETGLETGATYQYYAEAYLTNYEGQSRRVSEVREVTAGEPCSGPSTNCLRAETLSPEVSEGEVTLRGQVQGLDSYDAVTGRFFYWREGEDKQWTEFEPVEGDGGTAEFSTTLSDLPSGSYTYYAEARGEGGEMKNMYAEGDEREFTVE